MNLAFSVPEPVAGAMRIGGKHGAARFAREPRGQHKDILAVCHAVGGPPVHRQMTGKELGDGQAKRPGQRRDLVGMEPAWLAFAGRGAFGARAVIPCNVHHAQTVQ